MYFLKIKQKLCGGDYANEELLKPTAFITSALLVPRRIHLSTATEP